TSGRLAVKTAPAVRRPSAATENFRRGVRKAISFPNAAGGVRRSGPSHGGGRKAEGRIPSRRAGDVQVYLTGPRFATGFPQSVHRRGTAARRGGRRASPIP